MKMVIMKTERYSYDARESASDSLTVGELIYRLKDFPADMPIVFSNDNGYSFGRIWSGRIKEYEEREEGEEEEF